VVSSRVEGTTATETAQLGESARAETLDAAIEALPEGVVEELIEGQLYAQPRPAAAPALAASRLGAEWTGPCDRARPPGLAGTHPDPRESSFTPPCPRPAPCCATTR
jgi:hypothetical protein